RLPWALRADVDRLRQALDAPAPSLVLVGRRDLRSNNSWMHNLPVLVKGPRRCTLQVSPMDAGRLGLTSGGEARVTSRVGTVRLPGEATDAIMPGGVSIPPGWG